MKATASTKLRIWVKQNPDPKYKDWLWQVLSVYGLPVERGCAPTRSLAIEAAEYAREKTALNWEEIP